MSNSSLSEIRQSIFHHAPELQRLDQPISLSDYFAPVQSWDPGEQFPYRQPLQQLIQRDASALYGKAVAQKLNNQLNQHFIAESGTHLAFPREYDDLDRHRFDNNLVTQGQIISAAFYHQMNLPYHFGFYSSRVSADNTNGAKYIQTDDQGALFQVISSNKAKNSITYYLPPVNDKKIIEIEQAFKQNSAVVGLFKHPRHDDQPVRLIDQIAAVQAHQTNALLPPLIRQIVIDYYGISKELLADALDHPQSLTHQIFADKNLRDDFVHDLAGIRSGWRQQHDSDAYDSPFLALNDSGASKKFARLSYSGNEDFHQPNNLAKQLRQDKIMPTNIMEMAFLMSETGLVMHGGMFQSSYNSAVKIAFVPILQQHGYHDRAKALQQMPVEYASQSPCFGLYKDERLLNVSDLMRQPVTQQELEQIPQIKAQDALNLAAPNLYNFFNHYCNAGNSLISSAQEQDLNRQITPNVIARPS